MRGRSCFWAWYWIPAIAPTWPSYARATSGRRAVCVTDGVTERADGDRQFDDDDGLARLITGWAGLLAAVIADRIRAAVDDFAAVRPHDDVAVLVLAARPRDAYFRQISSTSMTTPSPMAVSTALRIRWPRGAAGRCRARGGVLR